MREPVARVHPGAFTTLEGMAPAPSDVPMNAAGSVTDDTAPAS